VIAVAPVSEHIGHRLDVPRPVEQVGRKAVRGRVDRIARSVRHFLEIVDELNRLGIEFISFRDQIDTGVPLGCAVIIIVSAVAEIERNLIVERVRAAVRSDRQRGQSLGQLAKKTTACRATIHRVIHEPVLNLTANASKLGRSTSFCWDRKK
jgi:DNA invertase Pin-like site-specific DNA recombinase